jgi:hypothetical protein
MSPGKNVPELGHFFIYKIALDFFSEINPYLLLLCSSHLRRKYFVMFSNMFSNVFSNAQATVITI